MCFHGVARYLRTLVSGRGGTAFYRDYSEPGWLSDSAHIVYQWLLFLALGTGKLFQWASSSYYHRLPLVQDGVKI